MGQVLLFPNRYALRIWISAKEALVQLQEAVGGLSGARTRVDATQNHLTRAIQNLCPNIEHLTTTASATRDADVAKEVTG